MALPELVAQIAKRDTARTEATLQADIRQLLLNAPLSLTEGELRDVSLEAHAGGGGHPDRGPIQVPVYLGDAVQWRREAQNLFTGGNLVIETDDEKQLFESELRFPN